MKEYGIAKLMGILVGTLTIFAAFGFGLLALIGSGLSNTWDNDQNSNEILPSQVLIFTLILMIGIVTLIGVFGLKRKTWRVIYIGICIVLGFVFVGAFIISYGSIGTKSEIYILLIGIIYLLQSFLIIKRL